MTTSTSKEDVAGVSVGKLIIAKENPYLGRSAGYLGDGECAQTD